MKPQNNFNLVEDNIRFFSGGQIALAAFLGFPAAGFLLLAKNYQKLHNPKAAWTSLTFGIVSTYLIIEIYFRLPEKFPLIPFLLVFSILMQLTVRYLQGKEIRNHLYVGRKKASWLQTIGMAILCYLTICLVLIGIFIFAQFN